MNLLWQTVNDTGEMVVLGAQPVRRGSSELTDLALLAAA